MLFALGFIVTFTIGGISGVMLGHGPDRHPRLRHLLHRRPHPLRALRRLGVHDLRRHLPLVPEDDRADVRREARPGPLLADPGRHARHLHPDALDRDGGDAAPRRRLLGPVRRLEPADLLLRVPARRRPADLPLQHDRQLALRAEGGRQPVAREDDRVAGLLAAAGLQLRRDPARRRRPVRVRRPRRPARDHARRGGRGQTARGRRGAPADRGGGRQRAGRPSRTSRDHDSARLGARLRGHRRRSRPSAIRPPHSREGGKPSSPSSTRSPAAASCSTALRERVDAGADYVARGRPAEPADRRPDRRSSTSCARRRRAGSR